MVLGIIKIFIDFHIQVILIFLEYNFDKRIWVLLFTAIFDNVATGFTLGLPVTQA